MWGGGNSFDSKQRGAEHRRWGADLADLAGQQFRVAHARGAGGAEVAGGGEGGPTASRR